MKERSILPALILVIVGVGLSPAVASAQVGTTASAGAADAQGIRAATVLNWVRYLLPNLHSYRGDPASCRC